MKRLCCTVLLGMAGTWLNAADKVNGAASMAELERMSGGMEKLSAQLGPKVVQIVTQGVKVAGGGEEQPAGVLIAERGCGSGFFVSADGYLFTNAHVVANATRIKVLVQPANGAAQPGSLIEYPGTLVGTDADNDLALVKIEVAGCSVLRSGAGSDGAAGRIGAGLRQPAGAFPIGHLRRGERGGAPAQCRRSAGVHTDRRADQSG